MSRFSTWTTQDPTWLSLGDHERAAAMSLMEADKGKDWLGNATNVLGAIHNRSTAEKVPLGQHVSKPIYQPTIEPAQRMRLGAILQSPEYNQMVAWSKARASGEIADPVGGATHFLAHEPVMERLRSQDPGKYKSWVNWTGYNQGGGKYQNVTARDQSHAFLTPVGSAPVVSVSNDNADAEKQGSEDFYGQARVAAPPPGMMALGGPKPQSAGAAMATPSSSFKWTPQENIARTDQWAKNFYDTPIDGRGGMLGSILTGALSGFGSGYFSSDASQATRNNQQAMRSAMDGAANAPDNITLGKILMGSGIPQLQQSGLNSIVAGREKADDRTYNEGMLKKRADIELAKALELERQKKKMEAETLERQLGIIDRMGGVSPSVPAVPAATPAPAPQLAPVTSGDAEAQPGYMPPPAQAATPAVPAAPVSETGNPLLDQPRAQAARYTPEQIQRAKSALALGDKGLAAKILSEATDKKGQEAYDVEEGKTLAKDMGGIREAGVKAQSRLTMLGTLKKLAQDAATPQGPGTTVDLALRKTLAAVGVPTDGLNNAQMFKALSNQLALELRDPSSGAGMPGAMSDSDRAFLLEMAPNLGNTRESNVMLLEYMERIAKRQSDVARLASNYSQNNNGRLDNRFYDLLGKWSAQNNIFTEAERQMAAKTAPAPAATQKMEFNTDAEIPEGKIVRDTVTGARLVKRSGQLVPYEEPAPVPRTGPKETPVERAARKRAGAGDGDKAASDQAASIRAEFDRDAASLSPIELVRKYDGKRGMLSANQLNSINEMIGKF